MKRGVLLFLLLLPIVYASLPPIAYVAAVGKPGTVFINSDINVSYSINGVESSRIVNGRGTGFVIHSDGYVLTNAHVVVMPEDYARDYIAGLNKVNPEEVQILKITGSPKVVTGAFVPGIGFAAAAMKADIKRIGTPYPGKDVAVLKVERSGMPTLRFSDAIPSVGFPVAVIGYPAIAEVNIETQLEPSVTQGIISAVKRAPDGWSLLQIDAAVSQGNSGGPVFDSQGRIVGIVTLGGEKQGFNFIIPNDVLFEFLRDAHVDPTQGVVDEVYLRALNFFDKGDYVGAAEDFSRVVEIYPPHPTAYDFLAKSLSAIESGPWRVSFQTIIVGVLIVLGVAVIVLLLLVFREHREIAYLERRVK